MDSIKLIQITMFINMVFAINGFASGVSEHGFESFLDDQYVFMNGYHQHVAELKSSENQLSGLVGEFLNAVEGVVNMVTFVFFFISLFLGSMITYPASLFSHLYPHFDQIVAVFCIFVIVINNIVLGKTFYEVVINKKVE